MLLNTHCHIDHVLGNDFVKRLYKVPFLAHANELQVLKAVPTYASNYGFPLYKEVLPDGELIEGESIKFGNSFLEIISLPGHAPGHVGFYDPNQKFIIAGDVLFYHSIGRTDLPGGNFETLISSIHKKLFTLPDDVVVWPGHGPETTIGEEKINNPFAHFRSDENIRHLPNALTCGNLICGCIGILLTLNSDDTFPDNAAYAAYFVWAACALDFFDGFVARLLHVNSAIGKELDSLADMISFGVLPSFLMYRMISAISPDPYLPFVALSLAVFSALRLAKFNIDENQKDSFIGVPTPANALFITSLVFLRDPFTVFISWDVFLVAITLIFSYLLVCPLELFALKFKNFSWADNKLRFTFIAISVLLVGIWQAAAIPFIILLYIIVSLLTRWVRI